MPSQARRRPSYEDGTFRDPKIEKLQDERNPGFRRSDLERVVRRTVEPARKKRA
jgi:hypothetical protein